MVRARCSKHVLLPKKFLHLGYSFYEIAADLCAFGSHCLLDGNFHSSISDLEPKQHDCDVISLDYTCHDCFRFFRTKYNLNTYKTLCSFICKLIAEANVLILQIMEQPTLFSDLFHAILKTFCSLL